MKVLCLNLLIDISNMTSIEPAVACWFVLLLRLAFLSCLYRRIVRFVGGVIALIIIMAPIIVETKSLSIVSTGKSLLKRNNDIVLKELTMVRAYTPASYTIPD